MPRILPHRDHISLHRLWGFATLEEALSLSEHAHILQCTECSLGLRTCLDAGSFGAVLKELYAEIDKNEGDDGTPRLRFLYVIQGDRRTG